MRDFVILIHMITCGTLFAVYVRPFAKGPVKSAAALFLFFILWFSLFALAVAVGFDVAHMAHS